MLKANASAFEDASRTERTLWRPRSQPAPQAKVQPRPRAKASSHLLLRPRLEGLGLPTFTAGSGGCLTFFGFCACSLLVCQVVCCPTTT
eukprot:960370-Amphidinium_carterae.2